MTHLHFRPVTNWKGRVDISCPDAATPMTHDWPHPVKDVGIRVFAVCYCAFFVTICVDSRVVSVAMQMSAPILQTYLCVQPRVQRA